MLTMLVAACGSHKENTVVDSDSVAVVAPSDNMLTPEQVAEGWSLLFDGKTMTGWRPFKNQETDSWEVVDGTLHCKPFKDGSTNKRGDILTEKQYENFEFQFDWKISPQGNSGVMYRVTEEFDQPFASGPEYQVIDDKGYPGDLQKWQLTGAVYDMYFPDAGIKVNPVGDWNTARIIVHGKHVEHWLNGGKVAEYELQSDDWNQRREKSKWKDFPGYGVAAKGHIDLQDHGNEVWFKNIKIKPL